MIKKARWIGLKQIHSSASGQNSNDTVKCRDAINRVSTNAITYLLPSSRILPFNSKGYMPITAISQCPQVALAKIKSAKGRIFCSGESLSLRQMPKKIPCLRQVFFKLAKVSRHRRPCHFGYCRWFFVFWRIREYLAHWSCCEAAGKAYRAFLTRKMRQM